MRLVPLVTRLVLGFVAIVFVEAGSWDKRYDAGLNGDSPFPRPTRVASSNIRVPWTLQSFGYEPEVKEWSGRLYYKRQDATNTCQYTDPGKTAWCPGGICCSNPPNVNICCNTNQYCASGNTRCCDTGTTACGDSLCCGSGSTCCGNTICCNNGLVCQGNVCIDPQVSLQSVQSLQSISSVQSVGSVSQLSVASVSSQSSLSQASLASQAVITLSSLSTQSVVSELGAQTRDGSDPNTYRTADVTPSDSRITYHPPDAWISTKLGGGLGSCTNGTKVTQQKDANLTFIFGGTDIFVYIIPSGLGGYVSMSIDGANEQVFSLQGNAAGQCTANQTFSMSGMADSAHELTVKNVLGFGASAGTLEFNSIRYSGTGAFSTPDTTARSKKSNSAVIGGSVAGAIGAVALIGVVIFLYFYIKRRRENERAGATIPATPNQPMLFQPNPGDPYSAGSQPAYNPGDPSFPVMSQTSLGSGYYPGIYGAPQHPPPGVYTGGMDQGGSGRPLSGSNPLPMWVERARVSAASPDNSFSVSSPHPVPMTMGSPTVVADTPLSPSGSSPPLHSSKALPSPPPEESVKASEFYGSFHPQNADKWDMKK